MRFRRVSMDGRPLCQVWSHGGWRDLSDSPAVQRLLGEDGAADGRRDLLPFLRWPAEKRQALHALDLSPGGDGIALLPVVPASFRDFMLYEAHAIAAARGMAKRFMPRAYRLARFYEVLVRKPFPRFRPHALSHRQPIYYMSGHLNMLSNDAEIPWPSYSGLLDYEVEIGAILARPLRNARPEDVAPALAGFVVLNDISARDVQIAEMRSGFGPQKSKHFASAMSCEIVTPDEILPRLDALEGSVQINGRKVAEVSSAGARFSLLEAIAHASHCETLHPGELFGSGTLPGGAGIENGALVSPGDRLTLTIDGIAELTGIVGKPGGERCAL